MSIFYIHIDKVYYINRWPIAIAIARAIHDSEHTERDKIRVIIIIIMLSSNEKEAKPTATPAAAPTNEMKKKIAWEAQAK